MTMIEWQYPKCIYCRETIYSPNEGYKCFFCQTWYCPVDARSHFERHGLLCDDHDLLLGHILINQLPDQRLKVFIGNRDIDIRDKQIIGSGTSACPPIHDCKKCVEANEGLG